MAKISDRLLQEKIGWKPTAPQQEILEADQRDTTISAGTRFGKSMLCGYLAFKRLLADNQRIWIVSLNYDMAMKIFRYAIDFAAAYDRRLLKGVKNRPFPRFEVKEWNSWIECKSIENESSLMGEELDLAILDEAARMKPDIYQRYITARLSSRQGRSFIISTPFGQNWFHRRYLQTKQAEDGASFHFESRDNPYFPAQEWDRARDNLPQDIFDQEYRAVFLAQGAGVFRGVREVIGGVLEPKRTGHLYTMGVDLGKWRDFTVLTVMDKYTNRVVAFDRFNKISWPFQVGRIIEMAKKYNRPEIWVDSTGLGDPIYDDLKRNGLYVRDFKFTNKSKEHLVQKLSLFIENKRIGYPGIDVLIDELESFSYSRSPTGNYKYSAPEGLHDDCVISLALATWPLREKPATLGEIEPIVFNQPKF